MGEKLKCPLLEKEMPNAGDKNLCDGFPGFSPCPDCPINWKPRPEVEKPGKYQRVRLWIECILLDGRFCSDKYRDCSECVVCQELDGKSRSHEEKVKP